MSLCFWLVGCFASLLDVTCDLYQHNIVFVRDMYGAPPFKVNNTTLKTLNNDMNSVHNLKCQICMAHTLGEQLIPSAHTCDRIYIWPLKSQHRIPTSTSLDAWPTTPSLLLGMQGPPASKMKGPPQATKNAQGCRSIDRRVVVRIGGASAVWRPEFGHENVREHGLVV